MVFYFFTMLGGPTRFETRYVANQNMVTGIVTERIFVTLNETDDTFEGM